MDYMLVVIGCFGCILGVMEALYGETPDMVNAMIPDIKDMPVAIQDGLQNGTNLSLSDNIPENIHSTGDHNVIKVDSNIAETISKSISVASAAVTEKLSTVISKVGQLTSSNVIGDVIS